MLFKRKYEFKPDRAEGGTLKKLYLTPLQRKRLLRWSLVAAALLVLSLLLCPVRIPLETERCKWSFILS